MKAGGGVGGVGMERAPEAALLSWLALIGFSIN